MERINDTIPPEGAPERPRRHRALRRSDDLTVPGILLADSAAVTCVRCGGEAGVSAVPVRPHAVWICAGCYAAVLRGEPVPGGQ